MQTKNNNNKMIIPVFIDYSNMPDTLKAQMS